ncbi:pentapeptide repeat-containing protein [Streptomyces beijiangensis]
MTTEDSTAPRPKRKLPWWAWGAGAAGTALFIVALIWGPWWIEGHHLKDKNGDLVSSAGIIVTGFRTTLIAIAAGAFTGLGLWYTHKSHQHTERLYGHSQEQFAHARQKDREQAELTREGQVTGRYVEAIKLLSSGDLTQRLGGIYSLERIMKDSVRDRGTVIEVLSAFIRNESRADEGAPPPRPESVQTALTVLGRREVRPGDPELDLQFAHLRGLNLTGGDWSGANFRGADLAGAWFLGANLGGARLQHAILKDAWLTLTVCTEAIFDDADLAGATLTGATGVEEEQLLTAWIGPTTVLPSEFARLQTIGERIGQYGQRHTRSG